MLLTLIALSMATILSLSFLASQSTSTPVSENVQRHGHARMIAETGLTHAIEYIRNERDWRSERTEGTWVSDATFADGTFDIEGYDGDGENGDGDLSDGANDPVMLVATGRYEGVTAEVRAVVRTGGSGTGGAYGVLAQGSIELVGNATIDSYDAREGDYSWSNRSNDALVATNGTDNGVVRLTGSSTIGGDVSVGVGADPDEALDQPRWSGGVTGSVDALTQPLEISAPDHGITEPVEELNLPSWGTRTFGTPDETTTYHWDEFVTSGALWVTIDGPVRVLVDGDARFTGGSRIRLTDNGSLELFVKGDFEISGAVPVNDGGSPDKVSVYVLEGGDVDITGSGSLHGTIVAPKSDARIRGAAQLYGGFHGQSLRLTGSAGLHQDVSTAVPNTGESGSGYSVRWVEP